MKISNKFNIFIINSCGFETSMRVSEALVLKNNFINLLSSNILCQQQHFPVLFDLLYQLQSHHHQANQSEHGQILGMIKNFKIKTLIVAKI